MQGMGPYHLGKGKEKKKKQKRGSKEYGTKGLLSYMSSPGAARAEPN